MGWSRVGSGVYDLRGSPTLLVITETVLGTFPLDSVVRFWVTLIFINISGIAELFSMEFLPVLLFLI